MADSLRKHSAGWPFTTDAMRTLGDRDRIIALYNFEGKNLRATELREKLEVGEIDAIAHCLRCIFPLLISSAIE